MNVKNVFMGIAITILTISAVIYGINTFYSAPEYGDFCAGARPSLVGEDVCPQVCVEMYEIREGECVFDECGSGCGPNGKTTFENLNQCEIVLSGKNCADVYENERESYSKNIFLTLLPLGILIIVLGAVAFGLETVGAGIMAGGIGVIFWGVGGFWRFADDWLKFVISLLGLAVLIWLAYYFNEKFGKKKSKK